MNGPEVTPRAVDKITGNGNSCRPSSGADGYLRAALTVAGCANSPFGPPAMNSTPPSKPDPPAVGDAVQTAGDRLEGLTVSARRLLQEATSAVTSRQPAGAERALRALAALAPGHPEVLRVQAAIAQLQGQRGTAIDLLRRALAARPGDLLTRNNLGHALFENGDAAAALAHFRTCADAMPTRAAPLLDVARALDRLGEPNQALDELRTALGREPGHHPTRLSLAHLLRILGRIDESAAQYRQVLRTSPQSAMAWSGLSTLLTVRFDADDVAAMERVCARSDLRPHERAAAGFALARALEDQDDYRRSFAALTAANVARRAQLHWNAGAFSTHQRAIADAFAGPVAAPSDPGLGTGVVFIVGMPRCGSTLVEQILAAHPQVAAGGELEAVNDLIREESIRLDADFPIWVAGADASDWHRLGSAYLARTADARAGHAVATDKGLLNWRYIGALRAMLPAARIVDCRRDALETCLSCYRQMFERDLAFTYDLSELAAFWHDYDDALRDWQARAPGLILSFDHERLLAEPEAQIRRLLGFCGLPFDPACLAFHEVERSVRTASAAQVRQPLRLATARSQRYEELLDPLRRLLEQPDRPAETVKTE